MSSTTKKFLKFIPDRKFPLIPQVCSEIKRLIDSGFVEPGEQLPSMVVMSVLMSVCKKTLESVYSVLRAIGVITTHNKVTLVCKMPERLSSGVPKLAAYRFNEPSPAIPKVKTSFLKLGSNSVKQAMGEAINDLRNAVKGLSLNEPESETKEALYDTVREILTWRNIYVSDAQLCLVDGVNNNLMTVVLALLRDNDGVVLTSPHDKGALAAFGLVNASLYFTGVDDDGMNVTRLEEICQNHAVAVVYLNPAADYPTCVSTSLATRKRILDLAAIYGFVIIEMHKAHELRLTNESISFWEMGCHDRVIYLSSVSRMYNDFNAMGVVVAAPDFISSVISIAEKYSKNTAASGRILVQMFRDHTFQLVCGKMIDSHRKLFDRNISLVKMYLEEKGETMPSAAGAAIWIMLHGKMDPSPVLPELRELGLYDPAEGEEQEGPVDAILLGCGGHEPNVIEQALKLLRDIPLR